ncbi:MAG: transporter substrate-binding domain-containing protein [Pseudomonadales bacterium]|uniref:Extracellular solute-binding protein n=1 Tax=Oleiphilus messinensis TaxID=141451 RepID=A0A1Y0I525_9GAMM|nr:transporter substrate-binding domain-containing protein [Oleiphilus messinensis]ARU54554.1 extracellular solute-binding protein [Oleiphilus messinensis]MCG8611066.1 transporter substrate-binding domain-containing protein [Pseudomonadales bacterium]
MYDRYRRFLFLLMFCACTVSPAETIVISTGEWMPLISSRLKNDGPISMVVREAFATQGIAVEFEYYPWKRALEEVNLGRVHGSSAWRVTPERDALYYFSDEVYEGLNVFFHLETNDFDWNSFRDLNRYRIGGVLGYAYSIDFKAAEDRGEFQVIRIRDEKSLVSMLLSDRLDAFPANREVGLHAILVMAPGAYARIRMHPKPLEKKPLHLVLKKDKDGKRLLQRFNQGLAALKKSGRYQLIYEGAR